MKKIKIKLELKNKNSIQKEIIKIINKKWMINEDKKIYILKYIFSFFILIFFLTINFFEKYYLSFLKPILISPIISNHQPKKDFRNNYANLKVYNQFIYYCKKLKRIKRKKVKIKYPYLSICISALNMEKYIEINLLSIINQSFQNWEIIIIK